MKKTRGTIALLTKCHILTLINIEVKNKITGIAICSHYAYRLVAVDLLFNIILTNISITPVCFYHLIMWSLPP